jgi:hypothetical protein
LLFCAGSILAGTSSLIGEAGGGNEALTVLSASSLNGLNGIDRCLPNLKMKLIGLRSMSDSGRRQGVMPWLVTGRAGENACRLITGQACRLAPRR